MKKKNVMIKNFASSIEYDIDINKQKTNDYIMNRECDEYCKYDDKCKYQKNYLEDNKLKCRL